jgi:hypothetical protein
MHGVGVLQGDHDRGRPGVQAELECRLAGIREQTLLELCVEPSASNEPRAVGGSARHEPVDPLAEVLAGDDSLVDEPIRERTHAHGDGRLFDRRVVVVVVVIVAHSASSQCSNTSTYTRSLASPTRATR